MDITNWTKLFGGQKRNTNYPSVRHKPSEKSENSRKFWKKVEIKRHDGYIHKYTNYV